MNATLQGLASVRAFNAADMLEKEFHEFQDHNTSSWYMFICASRWFALWLDMVCLLFIAFVTYSFLLLGDGKSKPLFNEHFQLSTKSKTISINFNFSHEHAKWSSWFGDIKQY